MFLSTDSGSREGLSHVFASIVAIVLSPRCLEGEGEVTVPGRLHSATSYYATESYTLILCNLDAPL